MIVALNSDNSHEIRQYPHRGFRTMDFCFDRQFLRSGRLYIDCMAGPPTEETGGFDRDLCVCQRISDGLMFDDGINAAAPFGAREGERELKRRPHQRHRKNPDQGGCAGETGSNQGQTTADAAQNIISGDADPLEIELWQEVRAVPYRIDRALVDQARYRALHDDDRNTALGRSIRIGAADYRKNISPLAIPTGGRGNPVFSTFDDPSVAAKRRCGTNALARRRRWGIGAGSRFGGAN